MRDDDNSDSVDRYWDRGWGEYYSKLNEERAIKKRLCCGCSVKKKEEKVSVFRFPTRGSEDILQDLDTAEVQGDANMNKGMEKHIQIRMTQGSLWEI